MIADRDIWRAAILLISEHGADAEIVAARRADDMAERGNHDGEINLASDRAGGCRNAARTRGETELAGGSQPAVW